MPQFLGLKKLVRDPLLEPEEKCMKKSSRQELQSLDDRHGMSPSFEGAVGEELHLPLFLLLPISCWFSTLSQVHLEAWEGKYRSQPSGT
jgi:hypothetical protein